MVIIGGPICKIKIPMQELWLKMGGGGGLYTMGVYMRDTTVYIFGRSPLVARLWLHAPTLN